ncbi:putative nicotinate-nucleotide adenylyltransferase [Acholeplasma oculi]|uniref:bis(5'-nucleosyl)-tetraphosphatase (symmetrical) n=1 Tax=Acholeplasma oculi TaxID=35623 RepID=A0A061AJD0_9MOLU|nr:bis(5'-nucleosyl)-tetraphosphatase (symmetrical) YqeK [Acholeplasma oculi]CDR31097.1 Conserved hypothetical protein CHP00488 [Acholeplasma oculi]SKC37005.1 putative HD superfamily hydrolase of NAD metabolism [Acholeplasma oculi]SUT90775.1 putative nicotinate-nucleotide adenylyltransferase [Acholeplasma oculi]
MRDIIYQDVLEKYIDKPDRLKHILGVAETAVVLADIYGVNSNDAYIAAIFHDYTKYDSIIDHQQIISHKDLNKYKDYPQVYHAISASILLKTKYNIHNKDIIDAVRYHVWGRKKMTLMEKIILIADKIEPSRNYPIVEKLRSTSKISLDLTIKLYLNDLIENVHGKIMNVHPEVFEYIKEYKGVSK